MSLCYLKILCALILFLVTILAGLWPLRLAQKHKNLLALVHIFACGIFLSAALLHLLPETLAHHTGYPLPSLICIVTYTILFFLERLAAKPHKITFTTPIFLIIALATHSLSEGSAIGINSSITGTIIIFTAVLAHKGSESIALTARLHQHFALKTIVRIIVGFSFITPLGILIASGIQHKSGANLAGIFNAIAAGTFLYLGTVHIVNEEPQPWLQSLLAFALGVFIISLVALWI